MSDAFVMNVFPHSWQMWLFVWLAFRSLSGMPLLLASLITNGFRSASAVLSVSNCTITGDGTASAGRSSDGATGNRSFRTSVIWTTTGTKEWLTTNFTERRQQKRAIGQGSHPTVCDRWHWDDNWWSTYNFLKKKRNPLVSLLFIVFIVHRALIIIHYTI